MSEHETPDPDTSTPSIPVDCHEGNLSAGSPNIFVNKKPIGRCNDPIDHGDPDVCHGSAAEGSPTVFANKIAAVRCGDESSGHSKIPGEGYQDDDCFPPRPNDEGSDNVFNNKKPQHRCGDHWTEHCCLGTPPPPDVPYDNPCGCLCVFQTIDNPYEGLDGSYYNAVDAFDTCVWEHYDGTYYIKLVKDVGGQYFYGLAEAGIEPEDDIANSPNQQPPPIPIDSPPNLPRAG